MEKIAFAVTNVFIDTNILKCRTIQDFSVLEFNSQFNTFVKFLKDNNLEERYRICITEIVFEELKKQIYDEFEETKLKFKNDYNRIKNVCGFELEFKEDEYKVRLDEMVNEYIEKNNITLVPIPKESNVFEKIIKRAINKEKPFSGINSESDKGFKDVIQWESIKEYLKSRYFLDKYMLLTKNSKDFTKELEEEFYNEFNRKIDIFYSIADIQERIMQLNELESNLRIVKLILQLQLANGELKLKIDEALNKTYEDLDIDVDIEKIEDLIYIENDTYEFFAYESVTSANYLDTYWIKFKLIDKNEIQIIEAVFAA